VRCIGNRPVSTSVVISTNFAFDVGSTFLMMSAIGMPIHGITNDHASPREQIVLECNDRCNQENLIAQHNDGGVGAFRTPVGDLVSNWAYMVIASLAWSLKAWYSLLIPDAKESRRA